MAADGAAAIEILRAELAQAKEQARFSNAAAEKASAELKTERAAQHQDEEKMSTMALELKNATSRTPAASPLATSRTTDIAELQRKLDVAGDDIALINMRLDESQGMYSGQSSYIFVV